MNAEIRTKWIAALRSGKYRQGRNQLRSAHDNRFCCLGVLLDVVDSSRWVGDSCDYRWDFEKTYPPELTMSIIGLSSSTASYLANTLNDHQGMPFSQIADYIELSIPADPLPAETLKEEEEKELCLV